MSSYYQQSNQLLEQLTDENLEINITQSPRSTRGDIQTVAQLENLPTADQERHNTQQYTIRIQKPTGEYYTEVIIHILDEEPIALIDWIEVIDQQHQGHGLGRTLHEETIHYIDQQTRATKIYTKLENDKLQQTLIDTGFQQINNTKDPWYYRK